MPQELFSKDCIPWILRDVSGLVRSPRMLQAFFLIQDMTFLVFVTCIRLGVLFFSFRKMTSIGLGEGLLAAADAFFQCVLRVQSENV